VKELYSCVPLREGWGGVGWRGRGDDGDDRKSLGVADEGIANVIIYGDCDVLSKMSGGCTANRCSTDGSTTQDEI